MNRWIDLWFGFGWRVVDSSRGEKKRHPTPLFNAEVAETPQRDAEPGAAFVYFVSLVVSLSCSEKVARSASPLQPPSERGVARSAGGSTPCGGYAAARYSRHVRHVREVLSRGACRSADGPSALLSKRRSQHRDAEPQSRRAIASPSLRSLRSPRVPNSVPSANSACVFHRALASALSACRSAASLSALTSNLFPLMWRQKQ